MKKLLAISLLSISILQGCSSTCAFERDCCTLGQDYSDTFGCYTAPNNMYIPPAPIPSP
ncbi:MAG: hypothetical protein IJV56_02055 [Neisseriaceae bacterium]|nr:hypothetical protein [Neisseriaceae bacterium]